MRHLLGVLLVALAAAGCTWAPQTEEAADKSSLDPDMRFAVRILHAQLPQTDQAGDPWDGWLAFDREPDVEVHLWLDRARTCIEGQGWLCPYRDGTRRATKDDLVPEGDSHFQISYDEQLFPWGLRADDLLGRLRVRFYDRDLDWTMMQECYVDVTETLLLEGQDHTLDCDKGFSIDYRFEPPAPDPAE